MAAWRRVLLRVSRAAWRLEQAGRERSWALASARAEGVSVRKLAAAAGLSPARVHQIAAAVDLDGLDAALGELRAAGWPTPDQPRRFSSPWRRRTSARSGPLSVKNRSKDSGSSSAGNPDSCSRWASDRNRTGIPPTLRQPLRRCSSDGRVGF